MSTLTNGSIRMPLTQFPSGSTVTSLACKFVTAAFLSTLGTFAVSGTLDHKTLTDTLDNMDETARTEVTVLANEIKQDIINLLQASKASADLVRSGRIDLDDCHAVLDPDIRSRPEHLREEFRFVSRILEKYGVYTPSDNQALQGLMGGMVDMIKENYTLLEDACRIHPIPNF